MNAHCVPFARCVLMWTELALFACQSSYWSAMGLLRKLILCQSKGFRLDSGSQPLGLYASQEAFIPTP